MRKRLRRAKKMWTRILEIDRKAAAYDRDSIGQTLPPCRSGDCRLDHIRSDMRGLTDCEKCRKFLWPNPARNFSTWAMALGIATYSIAGMASSFVSFARSCIGPNG